jgi:hypothetical protein
LVDLIQFRFGYWIAGEELTYLLEAICTLIGDFKGQKLYLHHDQSARSEFVIRLPRGDDISIGINKIKQKKFGMRELEQPSTVTVKSGSRA